MTVGTILVVLFSDPMVDILGAIGKRTGIPAFYVSFALAPLASNGSELVAAYSYGQKKTRDSISMAISQCIGACCLNNTFCLAIFLGLVYFRQLVWEFSAETISIVLIQLLVGVIAMKRVQTLMMAFLVLSLFPVSVALVAFLESSLVGLN